MDRTPSLRRKHVTATYGKRRRMHANSAQSSPSVARSSLAAADVTSSSSLSSDGEARPSDPQPTRRNAVNHSSSPQTARANNTTSKDRPALAPISVDDVSPLTGFKSKSFAGRASNENPSSTLPSARASTSRSAFISRSASSTTPGLFPKPGSPSTARNPTESFPQRPQGAASPTAAKSHRSPVKRSVSSSPKRRSVSPSKRPARSRTPSRPAQDLASLFDAIEPTLPQPRNPFVRSESQPTVHLHQSDAEVLLSTQPVFAPSPLPSPTLPVIDLVDDDDHITRGAFLSPSKRPRMADRMGLRAARSTKPKVDEIAEALTNSRRGSLRRTETAPSALLNASAPAPLPFQAAQRLKEDQEPSVGPSDAASSRLDATSQADTQSQDGTLSASGARRLAGIKQASASNAKRTYGLQRSFLADQAEDNLLTQSAAQPFSNVGSRNIEDEIEAELNSNSNGTAYRNGSASNVASTVRMPDSGTAAPRESYAELLKKWGEGADDIEWDESQDPTLNLKSITSLRSQGELRRFNDDLEYLFSGLDASQSLSIRRSSVIELVNLLCGKPDLCGLRQSDASEADDDDDVEDPLASAQSAEFLRKLKASDLIARLFDLFKGAEAGEGVDDVLDAAMAIYIAKLLRTVSGAEPLIREHRSQLYDTLRDLITRADRPHRQNRKDGFALLRMHEHKQLKIASRSDRNTLSELRDIARISGLFANGSKSWTLRNLVLAACCSLISLPRRLLTKAAISELLIDAESAEDTSNASLFATVLSLLVSEGAKAKQRLIDSAKGLELVTSSAVEVMPDLESVDVCIRFLDKGMDALYLELESAVPASSETMDALQHLVSYAIQTAPFGIFQRTNDAQAVVELGTSRCALQVLHGLFKSLLDLSQVDANWSESLASSRSLQESVIRAFSLSFHNALEIRKRAARSNGIRHSRDKQDSREQVHVDDTPIVEVALFDDVVHLSLALLTNLLIKQLDKARNTLESVHLDPTCWRRRACATECTCDTRLSALQLLARVFLGTRMAAANHNDSNAAYLSNSIATAIAQYAVGNTTRLKACRAALDAELATSKSKTGDTSVIREDGFGTLLEAVEEFAVVHEAALHADRMTAAGVIAEVTVDAGLEQADDDNVTADTGAIETPDDSSNSVAIEAGQLIKDLAVSLRQMA